MERVGKVFWDVGTMVGGRMVGVDGEGMEEEVVGVMRDGVGGW